MPLLFRKRLIAVKTETTYGTEAAPMGADSVLVRNLDITPVDTQFVSRDLVRPFLGNFDDLPVATSVRISFEVEAQGSGTAGTVPAYGSLLKACGMSETIAAGMKVTYAPVSSSFSSVTIFFNIDGNLHKIIGARGSVSLDFMSKEIPVWKFEFTGLKGEISAAAALTGVTFAAYKEPLPVNNIYTSGVSLLGFVPILKMASFNLNNEITFRTLVGAETVDLVDRKPAGQVSIEAPLVSAKDFFAASEMSDLGSFTLTHGTAAGLRIKVTAPNTQIKSPRYTEEDGIAMLEMDTLYLPGETTGNDEISIEFT
jgi:hypothetical protein